MCVSTIFFNHKAIDKKMKSAYLTHINVNPIFSKDDATRQLCELQD